MIMRAPSASIRQPGELWCRAIHAARTNKEQNRCLRSSLGTENDLMNLNTAVAVSRTDYSFRLARICSARGDGRKPGCVSPGFLMSGGPTVARTSHRVLNRSEY